MNQVLPFIRDKIDASQRSAKLATCRHCGALTYVGWDDDRVAAWAQVDTEPVDRLHEVVGILNGSHSYDLVVRGNAPPVLYHRDPEHVHSRKREHDVHLEHECRRERPKENRKGKP